VDLLKRSEAPDAGAILEAVKDIFCDICEDLQDLAGRARKAVRDAKHDAHRSATQKERAEASMAEMYDAGKATEVKLRLVTKERDALAEQVRVTQAKFVKSEAIAHELFASVRARGSSPTAGATPRHSAPSQTTNGSIREQKSPEDATNTVSIAGAPSLKEDSYAYEASKRRVDARLSYKPPKTAGRPAGVDDSGENSPAESCGSESASECPSDVDDDDDVALRLTKLSNDSRNGNKTLHVRSPVAPSTVSPNFAKSLRGVMHLGNNVRRGNALGVQVTMPRQSQNVTAKQTTTPFDQSIFPENKPPPRWASETASLAAAAAASRGVSRGGAGQFGPDRSLLVPKNSGGTNSGSSLTESNVARQASARAYGGLVDHDGAGGAFFVGNNRSAASSVTTEHAVASARPWTLKQLREVVHEIVTAKLGNDQRQCLSKKPRETMREHVLTFLNHKFGVKAVIAEWFESIAAATARFAGVDCEMAVFSKIMLNLVDEEYFVEQTMVGDTICELLKSYVKAGLAKKQKDKASVSDELLRKEFQKKQKGNLFDDEWLDMTRFMYGGKDMAGVVAAVREAQRANENASFSEELERLTVENRTPGTRRRSTADLEQDARVAARKRLPFKDFVQTCLFHGLQTHELVLSPVTEVLRDLGVLRDGVLSETQFHELCERTRPDLSVTEIETLVLALDPWNAGRITASGCYAALVPGLNLAQDELITRGLPGTETSKTSLGGVGHGQLWPASNTYEGGVFSSK
jgi:hypothetical protein